MKKTCVRLTVDLIINHQDNQDAKDISKELAYSFQSQTNGAEIEYEEVSNIEIRDFNKKQGD